MVIYSYQFLTSILNFRRKPIFLIIHKSQCAACQYLQNIFNRSKELPTYAQDFVMVNAEVCIYNGSYIKHTTYLNNYIQHNFDLYIYGRRWLNAVWRKNHLSLKESQNFHWVQSSPVLKLKCFKMRFVNSIRCLQALDGSVIVSSICEHILYIAFSQMP